MTGPYRLACQRALAGKLAPFFPAPLGGSAHSVGAASKERGPPPGTLAAGGAPAAPPQGAPGPGCLSPAEAQLAPLHI